MSELLNFVHKIRNDEEARNAFLEDPQCAMDAAGLSDEEKEVLNSKDRERLGRLIGLQIEANPVPVMW